MSGAIGVAGWIAQIAFWAIFLLGIASGELRGRTALVCFVIWVFGFFALRRLFDAASPFVTPYVAILDIVLAFIVFKEDVRLS